MTVSTRDRLHNSSFFQINTPFFIFFKSTTHPLSHRLCIVHQKWWEDIKNKLIPRQHLHLHQHQHQWCLQIGTLHHLCKMSGLIHNMLGWLRNKNNKLKSFRIAEFNCVQYRILPGNASRGKNVLRTSKNMSMTATDHITQQEVASYLREAIWSGNKMLPKSWRKWRDDKRSLCQMILKRLHYLLVWMESHTGRHNTRDHKQQVLLVEGKLQARVVWAVSR